MRKYIKLILEVFPIFIVTYLIFHYLLLPVTISGNSMYPYLKDDEISIMDAIHTGKNDIKRFDIVVLYSDDLGKLIIKRVIGLPGETVSYKDDKLYINGQYYEENYLDKNYVEESKSNYQTISFTEDFEVKLKDDELYVLGDNRIVSLDSRAFVPIQYKDIKAKNGLVIFPFNEMKWMD